MVGYCEYLDEKASTTSTCICVSGILMATFESLLYKISNTSAGTSNSVENMERLENISKRKDLNSCDFLKLITFITRYVDLKGNSVEVSNILKTFWHNR